MIAEKRVSVDVEKVAVGGHRAAVCNGVVDDAGVQAKQLVEPQLDFVAVGVSNRFVQCQLKKVSPLKRITAIVLASDTLLTKLLKQLE